MKTFCVYKLFNSLFPNDVRYIGKSFGDGSRRLAQHRADTILDTPKSNWIREVRDSGGTVEMELIHSGIESEAESFRVEAQEIRNHVDAGHYLTNACCNLPPIVKSSADRRSTDMTSKRIRAICWAIANEIIYRNGGDVVPLDFSFLPQKTYKLARMVMQPITKISMDQRTIRMVESLCSAYSGFQPSIIARIRNSDLEYLREEIKKEAEFQKMKSVFREIQKENPGECEDRTTCRMVMRLHPDCAVIGDEEIERGSGVSMHYILRNVRRTRVSLPRDGESFESRVVFSFSKDGQTIAVDQELYGLYNKFSRVRRIIA